MMISLISCAQSIRQGNWLLTSPAQKHAFSQLFLWRGVYPIYCLDYKRVGPADLHPELLYRTQESDQSYSVILDKRNNYMFSYKYSSTQAVNQPLNLFHQDNAS